MKNKTLAIVVIAALAVAGTVGALVYNGTLFQGFLRYQPCQPGGVTKVASIVISPGGPSKVISDVPCQPVLPPCPPNTTTLVASGVPTKSPSGQIVTKVISQVPCTPVPPPCPPGSTSPVASVVVSRGGPSKVVSQVPCTPVPPPCAPDTTSPVASVVVSKGGPSKVISQVPCQPNKPVPPPCPPGNVTPVVSKLGPSEVVSQVPCKNGDIGDSLNRAELAKLITVTKNVDPSGMTGCFPDVAGQWSETYVCYVTSKGYMGAIGDGTFLPANLVSRAEGAKVFYSAFMGDKPYVGNETFYNDVPLNAWYYISVNTLAMNKVADIMPNSNSNFYPSMILTKTRAQMWADNVVTNGLNK